MNVTLAVWERDPLAPVTLTMNVPAGPKHDKVELAAVPNTILVGVRVHVMPVGAVEEESVTVPVKPFRDVKVIAELPVAPASRPTLVGLDEIVKS